MSLRVYLLAVVFVFLSHFARAVIPITSNDAFNHVIYDYNYHKFIAVGKRGTVVTSVDGKKWTGYQTMETDAFITVESSFSLTSGVAIITGKKLYTFYPDTGTFRLVKTFPEPESAEATAADLYGSNVFYRAVKLTDSSTAIEKCEISLPGTARCWNIYMIKNGSVLNLIPVQRNTLIVKLRNSNGSEEELWSGNTDIGYNFVSRLGLTRTGQSGGKITSDGIFLYDWRITEATGSPNYSRQEVDTIYSVSILNRLANPVWTPLGNYHHPDRLDEDTYAAFFGEGGDSGLSDDDDGTFILAGENREHQVELFAADFSASHKIFRPFLDQQFSNVLLRRCGASAVIDGKVIIVLLGDGNKALISTNDKKIWQVYTM